MIKKNISILSSFKTSRFTFYGVLACLCLVLTSQTGLKDTNAKFKALYVYNFAIDTNWPSDKKQGQFEIGILGDYPALESYLKGITQNRKIGNQEIKIERYRSLSEVKACHLLYVQGKMGVSLSSLNSKLNGGNTLIITEEDGLLKQGSCINLYPKNSNLVFGMNLKNIEKHHLSVTSKLKSMADEIVQ